MDRVAGTVSIAALAGLPSVGPSGRFPVPPAAPAHRSRGELEELIEIGRRNAAGRWPLDGRLAEARNHHATNRSVELRDALRGPYDWLEVDVRRVAGVLVASHDRAPSPDALRMRDWVQVAAATHRGIKLDFKERAAIAPTLDLVAAAGVPDERLVINVPVLDARGLTLAQLRRIRRRFPRATINLSLGDGAYGRGLVRRAVALGRAVGGPVAFPLDLARVDRATVRALRAGGAAVAIWNDPRRTPVRDVDGMRRRLRSWGVDGTIDLR